MAVNRELIEVFNDCVNRMNTGQSALDCLRLYPQYADQLRPMLETTLAARRGMGVDAVELSEARTRVRQRLLDAPPIPVRRVFPLRTLAVAAASLLIVFFVTSLVAESSLPGDPLYGVKRLTEGIRENLENNPQLFEARRIEEIQELLQTGREAEVAFVGEVEAVNTQTWTVAGLPLQITDTALPQVEIGTRVQVEARTQMDRTLRALSIIVEAEESMEEVEVTPTATSTLMSTHTPTATETVTRTPRPTNTATRRPPTRTVTPRPTMTWTVAPTQVLVTNTPIPCIASQPPGWVSYQVQAGDTLSGLAVGTGTTLEMVVEVNCIQNPSILIVGQTLFLPVTPLRELSPTAIPENDDVNDDPTRVPEDDQGNDDPPPVIEEEEEDDDPTRVPEDDQGNDDPPPVIEEEEEDDDNL